jgi:DNA ligase-1
MNESQMTIGSDYPGGVEPTGWLVSEKLNVCRAYFDGSQFWTRGGNVIAVPDWFRDGLPAADLDGEIWAVRGHFEEARCAGQYGRWTRRCRFVAFDAPKALGPWKRRMSPVRGLGPDCLPW